MTPQVREILSWHFADHAGTPTALARFSSDGRPAGGGRLMILPVDLGLGQTRAAHAGGGAGSIIGCNSLQCRTDEAIRMPGAVMDVYASPAVSAGTY